MNVDTAKNDLPLTHDTIHRKYDAKAISSKVQYSYVTSAS